MPGDLRRHALPTAQPGRDDLPGVLPVSLGTGRTDRRPSIPARLVDHSVRRFRQLLRDRHQLAGARIGSEHGRSQPDGPYALARGHRPGQPPAEVRACGPVDQPIRRLHRGHRGNESSVAEYWRRYRWPLTATLILAGLAAIALLTGLPGSRIVGGGFLVGAVICLIVIKHDLLRGPNDRGTEFPDE